MEHMARRVGREGLPVRGLAPGDDLPDEYWQALLEAAGADGGQAGPGTSERLLRLSQGARPRAAG